MTAPLLDLDDNRVQKKGHRTIWVPYLDARGRTFHQKQEDNGGIPGTYVGWCVNGSWVALGLHGHDGPEGPVWSAGPLLVTVAIEGGYLLLPMRSWKGVDLSPFVERHRGTTVCACGMGIGAYGWLIDARTADERVLCDACRRTFERRWHEDATTYREMECACGTPCYVQVEPTPRERGPWHDVLPCPKCARLACAECLAEGAKSCRGCAKTRRRKAA